MQPQSDWNQPQPPTLSRQRNRHEDQQSEKHPARLRHKYQHRDENDAEDGAPSHPSIAFRFEEHHRHRQLQQRDGTEAIVLGQRIAFERHNIRKLSGGVLGPNIASFKAFTRAGWVEEGRLRDHYLVDGEPVDWIVISCLNPAWRRPISVKPFPSPRIWIFESLRDSA